jgi:DNA modification methylase
MASEKTKRICRSVEIDPLYVALIVRRFEVATSNPAVLAETSETFKPLAPRRAREAAPV